MEYDWQVFLQIWAGVIITGLNWVLQLSHTYGQKHQLLIGWPLRALSENSAV